VRVRVRDVSVVSGRRRVSTSIPHTLFRLGAGCLNGGGERGGRYRADGYWFKYWVSADHFPPRLTNTKFDIPTSGKKKERTCQEGR
jgi:hypothetical protein